MKIGDKKVVVTGGSSGIGLQLVRLLLEEGCTVVAAARNVEKIDISNDRLFLKKCDVSSSQEIDRLFDDAISKMGRIDIFIANAGFAYCEKIQEPDWDHIKAIFDTNMISLVYCAEKMKQLNSTAPYQFICTASGMSFVSLPGYSLYSGTKAAIRGFADAYRYELDRGQLFQVVYPVATKTSFFKNAGDSPLPYPVQSVETVAVSIIDGIKRGRKNIFPSKVFYTAGILNRFFPFIFKIYLNTEKKKFMEWWNG